MVDAPERIWVGPANARLCGSKSQRFSYDTEYVRADILAKKEEELLSKSRELIRLQSELAQTRRKALEEAFQIAISHFEVCTARDIRALIEKEAG